MTANSFSGNGAGLTGIFSFYSLNAVNASAPVKPSGYNFIGQTQTLTLTASQRLTGAGSIPLATTSGTTPATIGLCYSVNNVAITNFAGSAEATVIIDGTLRMQSASATVQPGAGSVQFGLCVGNNSQPLTANNVDGCHGHE